MNKKEINEDFKVLSPVYIKTSLRKTMYNKYTILEDKSVKITNEELLKTDLYHLVKFLDMKSEKFDNIKCLSNNCFNRKEMTGNLNYKEIENYMKERNINDLYLIYLLLIQTQIKNPCLLVKILPHNMNINCEEAFKLIQISNSDCFIKNVNFLIENLTNNPFLSTGLKTDILSDSTNHIRIDAYRHVYPIAGINPKPKKLNSFRDNKQVDYIPCNHPGTCHIDICSCLQTRGYCEKNCNCFYYCEFLYKSCNCTSKCDINCRCDNDNRECDPDICRNCKDKDCGNMKTFLNKSKKITLGKSNICDTFGIFALEDINEGEYICEYKGEILNKDETDRRSIFNDPLGLNYLFQTTQSIDIDAYRVGNEMRYVNHSEFGFQNATAKTVFVRDCNRITLYALRDISKFEEIFFDYQIKVSVGWLKKYARIYSTGLPKK